MNALTRPVKSLPAMSEADVGRVRALESRLMGYEQVPIRTDHLIHGGMYARTILVPAGVVLTGALLKVATVLILSGDVTVFTGQEEFRLVGFNVIPGSVGRKSAFMANESTYMTMLFPTQARDVESVEAEFTDEPELLFSRRGENRVTITGE